MCHNFSKNYIVSLKVQNNLTIANLYVCTLCPNLGILGLCLDGVNESPPKTALCFAGADCLLKPLH